MVLSQTKYMDPNCLKKPDTSNIAYHGVIIFSIMILPTQQFCFFMLVYFHKYL